ncbi:hypothetical protein GCM10023083_88050 [Streptomyces phyllanthi]
MAVSIAHTKPKPNITAPCPRAYPNARSSPTPCARRPNHLNTLVSKRTSCRTRTKATRAEALIGIPLIDVPLIGIPLIGVPP